MDLPFSPPCTFLERKKNIAYSVFEGKTGLFKSLSLTSNTKKLKAKLKSRTHHYCKNFSKILLYILLKLKPGKTETTSPIFKIHLKNWKSSSLPKTEVTEKWARQKKKM